MDIEIEKKLTSFASSLKRRPNDLDNYIGRGTEHWEKITPQKCKKITAELTLSDFTQNIIKSL